MNLVCKGNRVRKLVVFVLIGVVAYFVLSEFYAYTPDQGKPGGPIEGLTPQQLRLFYATKETFKHDFTTEEGLGPLFNGRSCWECHGKPGPTGGEGKDVTTTGVVRIAMRIGPKADKPKSEVMSNLTQDDVDRLIDFGGPAISRKSVTAEFPDKFPTECIVEGGVIPPQAELISLRHSGPLFGLGLIDAIPESDIAQNVFRESEMNPNMVGRLTPHFDPLTERIHVGKFGWKNQNPNIIIFTNEALRTEMGITTYIQPSEKFGKAEDNYPVCIRKLLPGQPNDQGTNLIKLTYFQSLLAPPPRGQITEQVKRGEKVFDRLQCSVCHTPVMYTAPIIYVVDPNSPAPRLNYLEIRALENKPVKAYSDFLVHQMGVGLADGVPQAGAKGGEWRTTPLWGLRLKKFFLHDGRTRDLAVAILSHGGQAQEAVDKYRQLPTTEREDILAFLHSL